VEEKSREGDEEKTTKMVLLLLNFFPWNTEILKEKALFTLRST
jgi:hypothetical protein